MIDIALILTMTTNFFIISWRNEPRTQIIRWKCFVFPKYTPSPFAWQTIIRRILIFYKNYYIIFIEKDKELSFFKNIERRT